jgi:hypothetical protein
MRSIVARTASAKRRTGGTGLTVEPAVRASGSAERSQIETVFGQTRKTRAARSRLADECACARRLFAHLSYFSARSALKAVVVRSLIPYHPDVSEAILGDRVADRNGADPAGAPRRVRRVVPPVVGAEVK